VPIAGAGQLLWQSLSAWHCATHIVPPPELVDPLELLVEPPFDGLL
jgi:hypothetical protein